MSTAATVIDDIALVPATETAPGLASRIERTVMALILVFGLISPFVGALIGFIH